jgi:dihydropteroate synthase
MFDTTPTLHLGGVDLPMDKVLVMGILNVTPDSFSDGGHYFASVDAAVEHGSQMLDEGADIIDIGGESTRPGAAEVSVDEELSRVIPVITALYAKRKALISIDTSKPEVMREAVRAGACLINDVRALTTPGAMEAAAQSGASVVLMHMQNAPANMQQEPYYADVVEEVARFLTDRIFAAQLAGIDKKKIIVDPGFGFGKTLTHNLELLANLRRFRQLECPLLVGLSRKRSIGELTGRDRPIDRMAGSLAAHLIAVERGAQMVRTHDVAATVDALKVQARVPVARVIKNSSSPDLSALFG